MDVEPRFCIRSGPATITVEQAARAWRQVLGNRRIPPLFDGYEDHELIRGPQGGWILPDRPTQAGTGSRASVSGSEPDTGFQPASQVRRKVGVRR